MRNWKGCGRERLRNQSFCPVIAKYCCKVTVYCSPLNSFVPLFNIQNYNVNLLFCSDYLEGNALNKNIARIFSHHWKMHFFFLPLTRCNISTHSWLFGSLIPILAQTQTVMTHFFLVFYSPSDSPWNCILTYAVFTSFRLFTVNPPTCCYLLCDLHGC